MRLPGLLLPNAQSTKGAPFMPKGPIYLLLDDADNLNETQTRILNSWVFCRTSSDVSLKISTQLNYKTFRTATINASIRLMTTQRSTFPRYTPPARATTPEGWKRSSAAA